MVPRERSAAYRALGHWNDVTVDDLVRAAVARAPEREALVDPSNKDALLALPARRLSWAELAHAVARCARALDDRKLTKDDVLLVQLPNCVEQVVVYLACMRRGIAVTPVPVQYREHELAQIFAVTHAKAALTGAT
ncbi:MAG TPA: AMP-binding protein, partial [Myxococcota bacterium]